MNSSDSATQNTREKLLTISRNITKRDLPYLKLLLSDYLDCDSASITDTRVLFKQLELAGHILMDDNDFGIVKEALYYMKQIKLLHKVGISKNDIETLIKKQGSNISGYRLFLFGLATRLSKRDISDIMFLISADEIPVEDLEANSNPAGLINLFDSYGYVSEDDVDTLKKLVSKLPNKSINRFVNSYELAVPKEPDSSHNGDDESGSNLVVKSISAKVNSGEDTETESNSSLGSESEVSCSTLASTVIEKPVNFNESNVQSIPTTVFETKDSGVEGNSIIEGAACGHHPEINIQNDRIIPEIDYKMTSKPRGKCLVMCNYNFPGVAELEDRNGSECDIGNIHYLFSEKLHFEVHIYRNETAPKMRDICRQFAVGIDHSKYDCFVCFILTHGELGCVYGTDGEKVRISEITYLFSAMPCPTLKGKPKLFFIQACQGADAQPAVDYEADSDGPMPDTIPNESDFLYAYSTLPGYRSFRSPKFGSWFVVKLIEVFEDHYDRCDLLSMLTMVNSEVADLATQEGKGHVAMCPAPMYTLRKQVRFM
ncbi:caspase-8-like [Tubulanus polymorphus]|uniref:caspase-8-like n=1 Tax=Tubulanus polymorphus TaxID=672921 RepID=UPI003DA39126